MHCFAVEETLSSGFVFLLAAVHVIVCLAWLKKTARRAWRSKTCGPSGMI